MNNMIRQLPRFLSSAAFAIIAMLLCHGSTLALADESITNSTNTPPTAVPPPPGLVAWWRAESNVVDAINGTTGFVSSGVSYAPGKVGTGFNFDGVTGQVGIPDAPSLNFGSNQNFSVEAWIQAQPNPEDNNEIARIAIKVFTFMPGRSVGWHFYLVSGRPSFQLLQKPAPEENHWIGSGPDLRDGHFHHVAAVLDRNTANASKLYVDGHPVLTFDASQQPGDLSSEGALSIANAPFKGIIDEFSLYNRALTDAEILSVYNAAERGKYLAPISPFIVTQPADRIVNGADFVVFNVVASGSEPLSYQWSLNGTNLIGATNSQFVLPHAQLTDAGVYTVVVSNNGGSITSSNAVLTVNTPPPAAVRAPDGIVGWWRGESNVVDAISGKSGSGGSATNVVTYGPGKVGSGFSFDGLHSILYMPDSPALNFGSNQNFSVEAWIQTQPNPDNINGIAIIAEKTTSLYSAWSVGWQFYVQDGRLSFKLMQRLSPEENHWTASGPDLRDGQFHHVAAVVDRNSVNSGKLYVDGSPVLSFDASQLPGDLFNEAALLIGCASYTYNAVFKGVIDEFSLYNRALTDTEILSVYNAAGSGKLLAPLFLTQPANVAVKAGQAATFNVDAIGDLPLSYQWSFNGTNIVGATNSSLTVSNVQPQDAGEYAVVIANSVGSITSSNALLTVTTTSLEAPQGLVGWWRGESNVVDAISGSIGFVTNGAGYGPGEVGSAFSFDGVYSRVYVPSSPVLNFGTNRNFSVEAWIQPQPNDNNYNGIAVITEKVISFGPNSAVGWQLYIQNGRLGFQLMQTPMLHGYIWTSAGPDLRDGQFHHVAATLDRASTTGGRLYVDGNLVLTFDPTQDPVDLSTDASLLIGNGGIPDVNTFFKGIIDEVSIYNRILTDAEILSVYNAAESGKIIAPFIVKQPMNLAVSAGHVASFNITARGSEPLSYQWSLNGINIVGATNSSLTLNIVQPTDAGQYTVKVSNSVGSVTSSNALLTLATTPQQAPQNLIGWWRGESNVVDTITGTTGFQTAGAGYETSGVGYGLGKVGTGFSFNGVNGQVVIPDSPALNFGSNQAFSVETWIQTERTPCNFFEINTIAAKSSMSNPIQMLGWQFYVQSGCLGFKLAPAPMSPTNLTAWLAPSPNMQDGMFHHVAVTLNRNSTSGGRLYVDGNLVLTFDPTVEAGDISAEGPLFIGSQDNALIGTLFKGIIDEFSLYNRELTSAEINSVYLASNLGKAIELFPPVITEQPASREVAQGKDVTINVEVTGTPPVAYQWTFNGTNIAGATGSQLVLNNVQLTNAGNYAVVVTNAVGSITSSNAVLAIISPQQAPRGLVGWWRGESNVLDQFSGWIGYETNGAGYGPGKVGTGFTFDGVNDQVIIPNSPTFNFAANQNFSVEAWIQALPTPGNYVDVAEIATKAYTPESSQSVGWSLFLIQGNLGFLMSQAPMSPNNSSYWVSSSPKLQDGVFHHVAVTVDRASNVGGKLYVDGNLVLTFDPTPESGDLSTEGPLFIGSHDNSTINANFKGIIDEVSLYNRALTIEEISSIHQADDSGKLVQPFAPVITMQPANQTVAQGKEATINVMTIGTPPLAYQWIFNGTNIVGATNNPLTMDNVQLADSGEYAVVITNAAGSVTSSNAVLTVLLPLTAPQGLVGWWRGESNVVDEFSGSIGSATNEAGYGPGKVGTGFSFNGVAGRVIVPNSPTLNIGSNHNFSVEAWIQGQPTPGNYVGVAEIVSKAYTPDSSQSVGWSLFLSQGCLGFLMSQPPMFGFNSSIWGSSGPNLQDGLFHHVGVTVDRSSATGGKLYVDGSLVLVFDPTPESGDLSTDGPLYIGCHDNSTINSNFKGIIDEVSIYNRALSSNEMALIYQMAGAGKTILPSPPIIATQPASQRVTRGDNVAMEVGAGGSQPLTCQWLFKGENIAGATNFSLMLTNVQFTQSGIYSVTVSNELGFVISSNAILRVDFPPAVVRAQDASGSPSAPISVPLMLIANGNENALSFSVNFDPSILALADVVVGSGAADGLLFANTNLIASGKLGLMVGLPADAVFREGPQEVARLIFHAASITLPASTYVTFGNQPTLSELSDVDAAALAANYESGTINIAGADFEGDVTPIPAGDKSVTMMDWMLEGRYVTRLDYPVTASEFQRADCAPASTRGDGAITLIDWVQTGRYAAGLDPFVPVGGPLVEANPFGILDNSILSFVPMARTGSEIKLLEMYIVQGRSGLVSVVLDAEGTENAVAFSLAFDPKTITFINASLGTGAAGALLNVNTNEAGTGRVGLALAVSPGRTFGMGTKEILKLNVQVATSAEMGPSVFKFTDEPVAREVSDVAATPAIATFTHGLVDIVLSNPTLQIRRFDDQVVLSWPIWATNFTLQVAENSNTNIIWNNAATTTILTKTERAVVLPVAAQNELYRLIESGTNINTHSPAMNQTSDQ